LHSRLLERASKLSEEFGGGSITALPIIETKEGDISAYIPTNVISITDGQIFLQTSLFYSGIRPAIDAGNSVSRVGGAAQTKAIKKVSGTLRLNLASFRELEAFTQFGSDLDESTKTTLDRGRRTVEILKQGLHENLTVAQMTFALAALKEGFLDKIAVEQVRRYESELYNFLSTDAKAKSLKDMIDSTGKYPEDQEVTDVLTRFSAQFS
jgi:F-type H+-transporting ATPase subunit alpha